MKINVISAQPSNVSYGAIRLDGVMKKGSHVVSEVATNIAEKTMLSHSENVGSFAHLPEHPYTGRRLASDAFIDKIRQQLKAKKYEELHPDLDMSNIDWKEAGKIEISDAEIDKFFADTIKGAGDVASEESSWEPLILFAGLFGACVAGVHSHTKIKKEK